MEPLRVYRYFNEEYGLRALQTKRWKLGRLTELNDPFDCQPVLNNIPAGADKNHFPREYFKEFYDAFSVICYSAKIDDPVMWSHYADSHRGLALAFTYRDPINISGLRKIEYPEDRRILDYMKLEELRGNAAWDELLSQITWGFTAKGSSWSYEDEYRHFLFLNASGVTPDDKIVMDGRHYFKNISIDNLDGIILGAKCSLSEDDIFRILREKDYHNNLVKMRANPDTSTWYHVSRARMSPLKYKMDVGF